MNSAKDAVLQHAQYLPATCGFDGGPFTRAMRSERSVDTLPAGCSAPARGLRNCAVLRARHGHRDRRLPPPYSLAAARPRGPGRISHVRGCRRVLGWGGANRLVMRLGNAEHLHEMSAAPPGEKECRDCNNRAAGRSPQRTGGGSSRIRRLWQKKAGVRQAPGAAYPLTVTSAEPSDRPACLCSRACDEHKYCPLALAFRDSYIVAAESHISKSHISESHSCLQT